MIRWLLLLTMLCGAASAETARVISGEHADFTRLVVELPDAADWTVGRTAMGYGFATLAKTQPAYDLSRVWERIPRTRLLALRVNPDNGSLNLALACDCHLFPFEYQPGMVVLDIRQGPAPPGSIFEASFTRATLPQPLGQPQRAGANSGYNWLGSPRATQDQAPGVILPFNVDRQRASLDPLRDELLLQLSRGAADGAVDMVLPGKPVTPEVQGMGDLSGALIRIGALPGLEVGGVVADANRKEDVCIPDQVIDISGWGDGRLPLDLLAEARAGLYEEFDVPSPEALVKAVRLHLYLGFGAEARQYGALTSGADSDPTLRLLLSMALLIDGEADPTSPFASMADCDGAAALWAALAHSSLPDVVAIDTAAVVRTFQALPPHLRRHLGPRLASLLLERDAEASRMIRDAFERTPDVPPGAVAVLDAKAELQASRPDAALDHAEAAVKADASGLDGLVALVEAHFQSGKAVSPDVAASLMAFNNVAGAEMPRQERALVLALALSGQTDEAFGLLGPDHPDTADLWKAVVRHSDDNAFLAHAVLSSSTALPTVDPEVGLSVAERLSGSGFHEAALKWLGMVRPDADPARRLVAAKSQLALGNARETLNLIAGLSGEDVLALQSGAFRQLGAYASARGALVSAGNAKDGTRLAAWDGDWSLVEAEGSPVWAEASALVQRAPTDVERPLAGGRAALADSAAARSAITALLTDTTPP